MFASNHSGFVGLSLMVFALDNEIMNLDLVINATTLKIQDLDNNSNPDAGDLSLVLGTLYSLDTLIEMGTYRASFI